MNACFLSLTALMAWANPAVLLGDHGQKPRAAQKKHAVSCWPHEPEIQNRDSGGHRPSRLPPEFANAPVKRSVMLLRVCVTEAGEVARVLVLESSGNPEIDKHYVSELSKRTFRPAERGGKKVRSVVPVAVTLHVK